MEGQRTVSQLRAMSADPVRLDLFEALRDEAELSTRDLERRVPAAKGGIENHLQKLAAGGWITQVGGQGRTATWRPSSSGVTWSETEAADPDVALAIDELYWVAQQRRINRMRQFDAERQTGSWPLEWVEAAIGRDYLLRLSPSELVDFESEFVDLVMRYRQRSSERKASVSGVERVFVTLSACPLRVND